jgi:hypothetical protein
VNYEELPLVKRERFSDPHGRKSFAWWVGAVLAPFGIIGGPLEMAGMVADIIEWRGPWNYLITHWDRTVGHVFGVIFGWIAGLVSLPAPPPLVADYLTVGVLMLLGQWRAHQLLGWKRDFRTYAWDGQFMLGCMAAPMAITTTIWRILSWPWQILLTVRMMIRGWEPGMIIGVDREVRWIIEGDDYRRLFLQLAPLILFIVLLVLNTIYGAGVEPPR